jgi:sodium transport system ATP-binding protein
LVEKLCDRVGIVMNGKMVVCDTLENLTKDCDLEDKFFQICDIAYEESCPWQVS